MLDQTNARFSVAWTEVSTVHSTIRLFGWWMQHDGADGVTGSTFIPVTTINQDGWDNLNFALPFLLEDIDTIWDEGDGVNENDYARSSPWSRFKNKLRSAARVAAVVVGAAVVVAVVAAAAPIVVVGATTAAVTAAAVSATTSLVAGTVVAAVVFEEKVNSAIDDLRDAVDEDLPDYIDTDVLSDQEIVEVAELLYV